jgi:hypothetical protein
VTIGAKVFANFYNQINVVTSGMHGTSWKMAAQKASLDVVSVVQLFRTINLSISGS